MGALSAKLRSCDGGFFHWCPGCKQAHRVNVSKEGLPKWTWDGNVDRPTCAPSVRNFTSYDDDGKPRTLCHYFLKGGNIEFCGDCAHELSGKTVPLPDWPPNYGSG